MKRYMPTIVNVKQLDGIKLFGVGHSEETNGEWVKWEEAGPVYGAAVALLNKIRQDHPEDFEGEGTGYTCPYVRELLHAVVNAGWGG